MSAPLLVIDPYTQSVRTVPASKLLHFDYTARQMVGSQLLESAPNDAAGYSLYLDEEGSFLTSQHYFYLEGTRNLIPGRTLLLRQGPGNFSRSPTITAHEAYLQTTFMGELDPSSARLDYYYTYQQFQGQDRPPEHRIKNVRELDRLIREPREPARPAHRLLELHADSLLAWTQFLVPDQTHLEKVLALAKGGRKDRQFVLTGSLGNSTDIFPYSDIDIALVLPERTTERAARQTLDEIQATLRAAGYKAELDPPSLSVQLPGSPAVTIEFLLSRGDLVDYAGAELEFMDPGTLQWEPTTCLDDKRKMIELDRHFGGQALRLVRLMKLVNRRFALGLNSLYIETFVLNKVASRALLGISHTDRSSVEARVREHVADEVQEILLAVEVSPHERVDRLLFPEALIDILDEMQRSQLRPAYFGLADGGLLNPDLYLDRLEDENLDDIATPRPACDPAAVPGCLARIAIARITLSACFESEDEPAFLDRMEKALGTADALCAPWILPQAMTRLSAHRDYPTWPDLLSHATQRYEAALAGKPLPPHWNDYVALLCLPANTSERQTLNQALARYASVRFSPK